MNFYLHVSSFFAGQLLSKEHKTHAAAGKPNDLGCFRCDTMEDGERCGHVMENETQWRTKCSNERRMCMGDFRHYSSCRLMVAESIFEKKVKRFSYTTSTENSTSDIRMWYLERNCTTRCEPGCIVIGERTKLYACTACCEKPFCNWMSGAAKTILPLHPFLAILIPIAVAS
ncbi:hypothetical protein J437_LFUL000361 [Ladona fulva]|uniref:Uncharacterized protein n=1 Tax=Ladona fulva TaxID=123851 RepID=A0A8K0JV19_LADFU|nr:hypothetical protein J437_LFUL000361 [Ladona fulva]